MYLTDKFIYVQLQKTGCTHIASLLAGLFPGQQVGKHNPVPDSELNSGRLVFTSVRNPWDWYLSLWLYGVQGDGALGERLTKRDMEKSRRKLGLNPRSWLAAAKSYRLEREKDVDAWQALYAADDVALFRAWIHRILAPESARFLGERFGDSAVAPYVGLLGYRYLRLCCSNRSLLYRRGAFRSVEDVRQYEAEHGYVTEAVRQERLEESLCEVLGKVHVLSPEQVTAIRGGHRTNTSRRSRDLAEYYDRATIELVAQRESFFIDRFRYSTPVPDAVA